MQTLFGAQIPEERLLECLEDCRKIFSLLTDRTGLKKNLLRTLEKNKQRAISCHIRGMTEDGDIDYANTLHEIWRWPPETGEELSLIHILISPIGHLKWGDEIMDINNGEIGPISQKLYDTLTGIQWGKLPRCV